MDKFWKLLAKVIVLAVFGYIVSTLVGPFWAIVATIVLFFLDRWDKNKIED